MKNRRNALTIPLSRRAAFAGGAAGLMGLGLAACGGNGGSGGDGSADGGSGNGKTITLGYIASWTDGLSTAYLLDDRLTAMGYTVEHEQIADAALLYTALANGDVDIYPSAWPEVTHASYMEEYGDSIEDLGAYYPNAKLTIAVPDYVDITSIADLKGQGDRFGGRIVGIEPGAGLTKATQEQVMPQYGLEDEYELVTSSTTAMTTELAGAVEDQKDIVVTLWRPFWANSAYSVKDLEDPLGALGESEALHFLAREGFGDDFADAAEFIGGITLDDAQYGSLEDKVVNEFGEGQEAEAIDSWLEENPDVLPVVDEG
ncbi:glycine betaine ABC transporter substrate-binding protein [Brachybacterium phenoliresistens]|uniref:glycine betaine ABC transporter substrate-binding protein n=1 Tax=Brachybacterium phenoliresistens TaxID=396014 RepID=UPI0031CEFA26